jgi:hypothetical protein
MQRYQRVGVVGTQVEAGKIARLTRDIAGGASRCKSLTKIRKITNWS